MFEHWTEVHRSRDEREVSWFEELPERSLALIELAAGAVPASIVDVGGGTSRLVDALLGRGSRTLAVLDIAESALDTSRRRLGEPGRAVRWIQGDVTAIEDVGRFEIWHDRAVFHFLTDPADRDRYIALATRTVAPGGAAIILTFALDGPERCSGLPVSRYDAHSLAARFGPAFTLEHAERFEHVTPADAVQRFTAVILRRVAA